VSDISAAVPTKSAEQLDLQALHRVRSRLIRHRTAVINQIRALLLERGISVRQGYQHLRAALPDILGRESERLSPRMVRMSSGLSGDWRQLDQRHEAVTDEIEAFAKADEACQGWIGSAGVTTHLP
jgi:transposase